MILFKSLFCSTPIKIFVCFFCMLSFEIKSSAQTTVDLSLSTSTGTEAGMTVVTVIATTNTAVTADETVTLTISGSNITTGDYTLNAMAQNIVTITIPNGLTTGTATFSVNDEAVMESLETAVLTISNPSAGITLGTTTTAMIHIEDNDIVNTATLYNRANLKNNSIITVQGKPYLNQGLITGAGTINGSFINSGTFSPGNN